MYKKDFKDAMHMESADKMADLVGAILLVLIGITIISAIYIMLYA
jgi:hypothetical protein